MSVLGQEQMGFALNCFDDTGDEWHLVWGPLFLSKTYYCLIEIPKFEECKNAEPPPHHHHPHGPSATGFISNFNTLKVQTLGFALQSWSFSVAHFGRGETGGCLVFLLFEELSTAVTLQMST